MLAYGLITVLSQNSNQSLYCKYEIDPETGFQIYGIAVPEGATKERYSKQTLSDFLAEPFIAETLQPGAAVDQKLYQANLIIPGLPASPADSFYNIKLTYNGDSFTLGVQSTEPFGFSPQKTIHFQALDLTFTQNLNSESLTVSGQMTAVILGQEIVLDARLNDQSKLLTFTPKTSTEIPIEPWGNLELTTFTVQPNSNPIPPKVLYCFGEESEEWVYDCSLINTEEAPAIDLKIQTQPDAKRIVQRGLGSIKISDNKEKGALITSQNSTLEAQGKSSASKLIKAFQTTNEMTIATWIKPTTEKPFRTGRIIDLSQNSEIRYVTLSNGYGDQSSRVKYPSDEYVVRLRTSQSDRNASKGVLTAKNYTVKPELTYIVYTLSKEQSNRDKKNNALLYFNGKLDNSESISLSDDAWQDETTVKDDKKNKNKDKDKDKDKENNPAEVRLALGNEVSTLDREHYSWAGELYEVAIYDSALTPEAIYQRYYPTIEISGNLKLAKMPSPLNQPLTAELILEKVENLEENSQPKLHLKVNTSEVRKVTPQFDFTKIELAWEADVSDSPVWDFKVGQIESNLWKNPIIFTVDQASEPGQLFLRTDEEKDLQIDLGTINTLEGLSLSLQPDSTGKIWQMSSTTMMSEIELPRLRDNRPFDWDVDFKLLLTRHNEQKNKFAPLDIANGKVVLKGTWLGEPLALYGWWRDDQLVMTAERKLSLPFQVALGPIFEPGTSEKIVDRVQIASVMKTTLILELTQLGFLARVSGTFDWTDEEGTVNTFIVPELTRSRPPLTPNQVLEEILQQLIAQADVIFAEQFHHSADYYFSEVEQQPVIYLGDRNSTVATAQTQILPRLFTTVAESHNISSTNGIFSLSENSDRSCSLTITPTGSTQNDFNTLKTNYNDFITQLDTNANLIPGILTLVKTRIAQRMPLFVDQTLDYYYGLNRAAGAVELQAGMRLRVDYQNYQFVHPSQSTANSGFVGGGTSYYYLNRNEDGNGNLAINFDAFLSEIQPYVTTDIANIGAGSSLDTFRVGYQKPYWRLVYPSQASGSTGSLEIGQVATLIGADSLNALDTNTNVVTFYFRGRATVIPEIAVVRQGQPIFVPVGTTLRQLMKQSISLSEASPGQSLWNSTGRPKLSRLVHEGVSNQPRSRFINLEEDSPVFDLPLVKGDRIIL